MRRLGHELGEPAGLRPWVGAGLLYAGFALVALAVLTICRAEGFDPFAPIRLRAGHAIQISTLALASGCFAVALAWATPSRCYEGLASAIAARRSVAIILAAFIAPAVVAICVLQAFPISGDEYAYLLQASTFQEGRLWLASSPVEPYLAPYYIFDIGGKLVSQYPPGWPALLAATRQLSIPDWLVNPLLGGVTAALLYRFALEEFSGAVALLATSFFALSAFYLFNSASFFNLSLVTLCGVLFVMAAQRFLARASVGNAIALGVSAAMIAVTRHYDAILFALPFGVSLLRRIDRRWLYLPLAALAAMPLVLALAAYYHAITGSALQPPQTLVNPWDAPLGPNLTVMRAAGLAFGRVVEFAKWTSPALACVYGWALLRRTLRGELRFYETYGLVFVLGYALYWSDGGDRWGPRYIYPAFPFVAVTTAAEIADAMRNLRTWREAIFVQLGLIALISAAVQVPFLAAGASQVVDQFEEPYRQIERAGIHHAVVLFASGSGEIWHHTFGNLSRNGTGMNGDVIYAHPGDVLADRATAPAIRHALADLHAYFPDRAIWLYRRDDGNPVGTVVPVR